LADTNPYVHFNGNAEEAFNFYKSVFGGEFAEISRFKDLNIVGHEIDAIEGEKIMHIELPIGANSKLLGSDTPQSLGTHNLNETRSKIAITCYSKEEADKIFNGLATDANVEMPIADSPWGAYFGMLRDKYGLEWMINYDPK
jgi:PhnB protein